MPEPYKTGRYRLRPDGSRVVLQVEEAGMFHWQQRFASTRWRDATPADLIEAASFDLRPAAVEASVSLNT
ncbi:hypothetical protein GCM10008171_32800 [Methylopila jiangsuensis]|uniref:Uncharacterized protein n=1 Tax=Methylopila jiangsuensis TaxID=586230 RepID=A0A9W6N597_9HYPH|nr:hypothetical protein GCM10008171_32800 [Methylopila jiangsuensis]